MKSISLCVLLSLLALAAPPSAATISDDVTGAPTFNRPIANGNSAPNQLSGTGTAVHYQAIPVSVDTSGTYAFQSTATNPVNWDNYSFLYSNTFSAATPLANILIGNDDNPTIG